MPYPPADASTAVLFALIRALRRDFDVTVLAGVLCERDFEQARELEGWCSRVVPVLAPHARSVFHRISYKIFYQLQSTLRKRSFRTLYGCPRTLYNAARRLSHEGFALVIVSHWHLYRMVELFSREKTVLVTHCIDLLVNREVSLLERNLVKKIQAVRRWLLERREELDAYQTSRYVWAVTEPDKKTVEAICRDSCSVKIIPFGVDTDFHAPSGMRRNRDELIFVGDTRTAVNRDALEYFAHKIYPHLQDIDGLSITIVGGNLPSELRYFGLQPEVEIVSDVADVRPYLHRASCLVVPVRFGGGLAVQILEAMAAELPVVCSGVALVGMPFEPEEELLRADSPEEYARQIGRILGDPAFARRIAEAARQRVRERFGLDSQERLTLAMVRELIEAPPLQQPKTTET